MNLNPSKPMTLGQYMPVSTMTGDGTIVHQIKLIQDEFILASDIEAYGCAGIGPFIYSHSMYPYKVTEPRGYKNN